MGFRPTLSSDNNTSLFTSCLLGSRGLWELGLGPEPNELLDYFWSCPFSMVDTAPRNTLHTWSSVQSTGNPIVLISGRDQMISWPLKPLITDLCEAAQVDARVRWRVINAWQSHDVFMRQSRTSKFPCWFMDVEGAEFPLPGLCEHAKPLRDHLVEDVKNLLNPPQAEHQKHP